MRNVRFQLSNDQERSGIQLQFPVHNAYGAGVLLVESGFLVGDKLVWGGIGPGRRKGCKSAESEWWVTWFWLVLSVSIGLS